MIGDAVVCSSIVSTSPTDTPAASASCAAWARARFTAFVRAAASSALSSSIEKVMLFTRMLSPAFAAAASTIAPAFDRSRMRAMTEFDAA